MSELEKINILKEGFLRGEVVDRADPLKAGRVKVFVEPLHKNIGIDNIPWAIPARTSVLGSMSPQNVENEDDFGSLQVPKQGSFVFVTHEAGDPLQPIYHFDAPFKNATPKRFKGEEDKAFEEMEKNLIKDRIVEKDPELSEYPNSHGTVFGSSLVIEVADGDEPRLLIFHPGGSRIEILPEGDTVIKSGKDLQVLSQGQREEFVQEDAEEVIKGKERKEVTGTRFLRANGATIRMIGGKIFLN